jgi:hypothetical protein
MNHEKHLINSYTCKGCCFFKEDEDCSVPDLPGYTCSGEGGKNYIFKKISLKKIFSKL